MKNGETMGEFHRRCACTNNNNNGLRFRLEDACSFYKIEQKGRHNAVEDVNSNTQLFLKMIEEINSMKFSDSNMPLETVVVTEDKNKNVKYNIKLQKKEQKNKGHEDNQNELKRLMYLYYSCFQEIYKNKDKRKYAEMFTPKDVLVYFKKYDPRIKDENDLVEILDNISKIAAKCNWNDALWQVDKNTYIFDIIWMNLAMSNEFGN
jgi:DNA polymerase III epsilon subunit-like protein